MSHSDDRTPRRTALLSLAPRPLLQRLPTRRVAVVTAAVLGLVPGSAYAAFTATQSIASNTVSVVAAPADTTAPVVGLSTVTKVETTTQSPAVAGRFRQNGSYRIYATATDDAGAGGLTVTANATTIGGGTSTTPLSATGGPWTVGGTTYEYRSAALTAGDVSAAATSRNYSVTATDAASNSTSSGTRTAVSETYAQAVAGTTALVGHYPLQSAASTSHGQDEFNGVNGDDLVLHTSTTGTTWTDTGSNGPFATITGAGRVRQNTAGYVIYRSSIAPPSADYTVEADVYVAGALTNTGIGITGRVGGTGHYTARYDTTAAQWQLWRCATATSCVQISTGFAQTLTATTTYRLGLQMVGSRISLLVNGATRVTAIDTTYSASGNAGVRFGNSTTSAAPTATTGLQLDNLDVRSIPTTAALAGTQSTAGSVTGEATFGTAGAITDDTGTSLGLDGLDDSVRVARNVGNGYLVADDFSLEAWFRSSTGAGTTWASSKGIIDATAAGGATRTDFGVGLNSASQVTTGVGGNGTSYTTATTNSGASPTWADGAWHQVVVVRTKSTGLVRVYVDGASRGVAAGSTASLTTAGALTMGANALTTSGGATGSFLLGGIDEVALYSTPLDGAAVLDHYNAGRGTG